MCGDQSSQDFRVGHHPGNISDICTDFGQEKVCDIILCIMLMRYYSLVVILF